MSSCCKISTHALTWSATGAAMGTVAQNTNFNSRAHVERDTEDKTKKRRILNFNSRAHVERDIPSLSARNHQNHFNSRAHVERDIMRSSSPRLIMSISTHALTWSATLDGVVIENKDFISTHALTWSATRYRRRRALRAVNFNSRAHVERDDKTADTMAQITISTHALTWSATEEAGPSSASYVNFNSRAHVERDVRASWRICETRSISTHALTWSATERRGPKKIF